MRIISKLVFFFLISVVNYFYGGVLNIWACDSIQLKFGMGQFKYGRNLKGKVVILILRYFGTSGPQCSHQLSPFLLSPYIFPFFHFSIFLSHSAIEAHTHTPSSSLYFSQSLTSKPAIHHHFWRISLENPIGNPISSILSKL